MVANNAAGTRTFRFGSTRAWVEALEVVLADDGPVTLRRGGPAPPVFGRLHRELTAALGTSAPPSWPRVRKNSSGYALDRFLPSGDAVDLLVGSEGTLGLVTGVTLRTAPLPPARAVALLPLPTLDALPRAVETAGAVDAWACEFFARRFLEVADLRQDDEVGPLVGEAPALVLVELAGDAGSVDHGVAALASLARELQVRFRSSRDDEEMARLWSIRHAASPVIQARASEGLVSMQFIEDSVVRADRVPDYLRGLEEILEGEETDAVMFGHAGDGNVHVNPLVDVRRFDWRDRVERILHATVELVAGLGGTLSGEHGDGRLRAPFHARIWGETLAAAFGRVKSTLDPAGILNPGVVVPLPGQDPLAGLTPEPRGR
jgi:FAD/FMN-containing dehydrogenase